jgi:hypothetical protein
MNSMFCVLGYVSPESFIPLASVITAAMGGLLLLGNRVQAATGLLWRRLRDKGCVSVRRNGAED